MHETRQKERERAILVGVTTNGRRLETDEHLNELALLADTAGAEVVDKIYQERDRIDPAYFVGRGKAGQICDRASDLEADLIIFDDDLGPAQVRNLERLTDKKIVDRSGLILDIFARRAKTREAKTQVELAQLNYLLPRLTRQWTHLSRQVGGIGTRGPGETQLEVDRRLIRKRISTLSKALDKIKRQREVQRQGRAPLDKVALVGYTNAGKSTLMNALTQADVFVENRLFATLDPTIRRLNLGDSLEVLLIDTVGFIRKLPHNLVASFKSTLEEAADADLLLLVADITDPMLFEQLGVVKDVLNELSISGKPVLHVFNKIDRMEQKALMQRLQTEFAPAVFVSAERHLFLQELREKIRELSARATVNARLQFPNSEGQVLATIFQNMEVTEIKYEEDCVHAWVKAPREEFDRLYSKLGNDKDRDGLQIQIEETQSTSK